MKFIFLSPPSSFPRLPFRGSLFALSQFRPFAIPIAKSRALSRSADSLVLLQVILGHFLRRQWGDI